MASLLGLHDLNPLQERWFDLFMMREGCMAGSSRRNQWLRDNKGAFNVMWTAPIPGA